MIKDGYDSKTEQLFFFKFLEKDDNIGMKCNLLV